MSLEGGLAGIHRIWVGVGRKRAVRGALVPLRGVSFLVCWIGVGVALDKLVQFG